MWSRCRRTCKRSFTRTGVGGREGREREDGGWLDKRRHHPTLKVFLLLFISALSRVVAVSFGFCCHGYETANIARFTSGKFDFLQYELNLSSVKNGIWKIIRDIHVQYKNNKSILILICHVIITNQWISKKDVLLYKNNTYTIITSFVIVYRYNLHVFL